MISIKKLFHILLLIFSSTIVISTIDRPFTIMLDPSGDANHTGRVINNTFERGISLQCAEQLKKEINAKLPHVRVVLTRVPGETIQPLQNASFANRLSINLYLSLYFYPEPEIPSHISIYYYLVQPTADFWHTPTDLFFYHINQAHLINLNITEPIGKLFLKNFKNKLINSHFLPIGLFGIPFKPLLGIKAPSLALEIGLQEKKDFAHLIKPLITCIQELTNE